MAERDALQRCDQIEDRQHPGIEVATSTSCSGKSGETTARLAAEPAQTSSQDRTLWEELTKARQDLLAFREKDQEIAQLLEELATVRKARNYLTEKLAQSGELACRQLHREEQRSKQREDAARNILARYQSMIEELQDQLGTATQRNGLDYQQKYNRQEAKLHALRRELADAKAAVTLATRQLSLLSTLMPVAEDGRVVTDRATEYVQRPDVVELLEVLKRRQWEVGRRVAEAARTHRCNPQPETREILLEHIWTRLVVSSPRLSEEWLAAASTGRLTSAHKPESV